MSEKVKTWPRGSRVEITATHLVMPAGSRGVVTSHGTGDHWDITVVRFDGGDGELAYLPHHLRLVEEEAN